jgi:hypothetical protein
VNRFACIAAGLLLAGCADDAPTTVAAEPGTEFAKPSGASRNPRIGTVGRGSTAPGQLLLHLTHAATELALKKDELVVCRGRDLRPTALLRITEIRGLAAIAVPVRGQARPDDEVVLPASALRQQAEALPPAPPGS